jgi:ABC-type antimicrobial peptide transport system permease subunit
MLFRRQIALGLWLVWQELRASRTAWFISIALLAVLVAIPAAVDLAGRAREKAVQRSLHYLGPPLSVVPPGVSSFELATARLGERTFPEEIHRVILGEMSPLLRGNEARLILSLPVGAGVYPVIGVEPEGLYSYPLVNYRLSKDGVLLGSALAQRLDKAEGDLLRIGQRVFRVQAVLQSTASVEDIAAFVALPVLQKMTGKEGQINEVRLFAASEEALRRLKEFLKDLPVAIVDSSRKDVAQVQTGLRRYQGLLYGLSFSLAALCVAIGTYINLEGRRRELCTLYTLGTTRALVLCLAVGRAAWVALAGALGGNLLALALVALQGHGPVEVLSPEVLRSTVFATLFIAIGVSVPLALQVALKAELTRHM